MNYRVTVNFFRIENTGMLPDWEWHDTDGHAPIPGDAIITPKNSRWVVVSRTWQHHGLRRNELHCNVIVRDAVE